MFQDCEPSFKRYLRTWLRLTAFKRRERHAVKSFTIDDVFKRSREEPTKRSKETSEFVEILSRQNFLDTKLIFVVLVAKPMSLSKICHGCRPTLQIQKND